MAFPRSCFRVSNVKINKPEVDQQGNRTNKHKVHLTTAMFSEEDFARGVAISVENLNSVHGVVEERVGGTFYSWKKRNIRLEDGYLLCYKTDISGKCRMLPLHLCMVRPSHKTTFKVVCATQFNLKFRASSNAAMREWVAAIQNGIAKALSCCNEPKSDRYTGKDMLAMLYRINPINRICADCSAQDPTWVSTSFGCLLCIECSGVHRSLGTHISKIRSFELDKWSEKIDMVEKLDNADVNSVFEYHIPMASQKPNILSDRESREKYIYDKYVRKAFMKKQFRKSGREVSAEIITQIYKQLKPTSHIGSNVFAKKVPYGPDSPQMRKLSLGGTVLDMMTSPILNRRGSLTPQLSSPARRSSVAPSSPFRRSSIAPSSPISKSPLSPTPVKREGSLVSQRRSSMMPAIGGGSTKLHSLSGSGGINRHVALYPAPMACM